MARPVRLERTTCGFEVRRSIQLSYGRFGVSEGTRTLDHWGHNPVLYPPELHSPPSLFIYSVAWGAWIDHSPLTIHDRPFWRA